MDARFHHTEADHSHQEIESVPQSKEILGWFVPAKLNLWFLTILVVVTDW